jgi:hypothetical protein
MTVFGTFAQDPAVKRATACMKSWNSLRLLVRGHSDAGIRNSKLDPNAPVPHLAHLERDFSLVRELARVAQQVEQNLFEPHRVCRERAELVRVLAEHAMPSKPPPTRQVP